jgi:15-cis-phytoene synthase
MAVAEVAPVSRPTSFYYAFLVLPRDQRAAVIAVWDFCRAIDDTVDEQPVMPTNPEAIAVARAALGSWRTELDRCYDGGPQTPQGQGLRPWLARFSLSRQPFADLIDGVEMDLDRCRYTAFEDLYEYCWRVASTVGLICLEIFGARDARDYAVNLGVALQLTNILRDVAIDFERGRVYLPLDDLARFGVRESDLGTGRTTDRVRELLKFEAGRARDYYRRARAAMPAHDRRALAAAEIMAAIYRALLGKIERTGYDVLSRRVRLSRRHQMAIALRTWLGLRFHVAA